MDPFTAVAMGIQVVGGIYKAVDGIIQTKAAREKMQELEAAALPLNAFEALQVNTESEDMQIQQIERGGKDAIDAMRGAGTRAIVGGLPTLTGQTTDLFRQIGADKAEKIDSRNLMIATEASNIEGVREARLRGLTKQAGEQYAGFRNQTLSGFGDIGGAAVSARNMELKKKAIEAGLSGLNY